MADQGEVLSPEMEEIQEQIFIQRALLASLEDAEDLDIHTERRKIQQELRALRDKLESLKSSTSEILDTSITNHPYLNLTAEMHNENEDSISSTENEFDNRFLAPQPTFDLVNRKRQREVFDDIDDFPEYKSRRATPSPSNTRGASPALSSGSNGTEEFNSASLSFGFDDILSEEEREMMEYLDNLEQRKIQEKQDEEFARLLQMEFNQPSSFESSQASSATADRSFTQSILQPNGSISRIRPPSPPLSISTSSASNGSINRLHPPSPPPSFTSPAFLNMLNNPHPPAHPLASADTSRVSIDRTRAPNASQWTTPTAPDVSRSNRVPGQFSLNDDGLEEITASDFHPSARVPRPYPYMPGSFPGESSYASTGGSSVYNINSRHLYPTSWGQIRAGVSAGLETLGLSTTGMGRNLPNSFSGNSYRPYQDDYFVDPAQTKEELKSLLKHIRPDEGLTPEQLAQIPEGLSVRLMPHQLTGLAWMKKMEDATNKGGILADDMGLGKTLQSIALILSRPPPADEHRPTLVVAPVALMQQWNRELETRVRRSHKLKVIVLHGNSKRLNWNALKSYDVVLTTYGTLASELKRKLIWEDKYKSEHEKQNAPDDGCLILGKRAKFHRVFLDEAQWIKNRNTKTAVAACRIASTYRWCLSGTPMQNGVDEIFSLIRFCRIRPYSDYEKFAKDFSRPLRSRYSNEKERAMKALQVLLRAILLRRTKSSEIDGKPILQLPPKTTTEARATFSNDELEFYKALESKAQIQFNKFLQRGSIGRNYSHALVLLLRLRQCCCHPSLIVQSKDFMQSGSLDATDLIANARDLEKDVVERLKQLEAPECPICMDATENPAVFPCGHALCSECLSRLCDQALRSEEGSMASCPHCRAKIDATKITDLVSFLRVHCPEREGVEPLEDVVDLDNSDDSDDDESDTDNGQDLRDFIVPDDEDETWEGDSDNKPSKGKILSFKGKEKDSENEKPKKPKKKSKGKLKERPKTLADLRKEGLRNKAAKRKYLRRLEKNWHSSAKIDKTLELLQEIRDRGQGEKTIIFSSFTSFLDLLEVPLSRHPEFGTYVRFDGSMTANDRNTSVLTFTDEPQCKVILVSLKAGNAGLNLTAANHVIILDPFWNPFVEYQAADRCYRIGQERDVTIHRVLIGQEGVESTPESDFTVEDRILRLQAKKKQLVETAFDESAGENVSRLGVRELGYLFGVNSLD